MTTPELVASNDEARDGGNDGFNTPQPPARHARQGELASGTTSTVAISPRPFGNCDSTGLPSYGRRTKVLAQQELSTVETSGREVRRVHLRFILRVEQAG